MKNLNLKIFATIIIVATLVTGCGLGKMVKQYPSVKYEASPNPLQTHGGKIAVSIKGTIPPKYFHKSAVVELSTTLKYNGTETKLKPFTIQGEAAQGNGVVVSSINGGSFEIKDTIMYKPEMNKSELFLSAKATLKNKAIDLGSPMKLADGVIYTSERVMKDEDVYFADNKYVKEVILTQKANIYFEKNKYDLNLTKIPLNKLEANANQLKAFVDFINKNYKIKNIIVNAWASPEGEEKKNNELSDNRSKVADKYIKDQLNKLAEQIALAKLPKDSKNKKVNSKDIVPITSVNPAVLTAKGEDWDGFVKALNASDLKEKSTILNVVQSQPDQAKKQKEINNMSHIYKELDGNILPTLRRAEMTMDFYEPKRTDEQIAALSTTTPDSLKLEELLYASTLTEDMNTKLTIFKNAVRVYPQDWRAYNNAASILINQKNADEAATLLEKANSLSPNNPMVLNGLGILASWKKDYSNAKSYFQSANSSKTSTSYNLGVLHIKLGEYNSALSSFAGKGCKYNVALVHVLNNDASGAMPLLDCAPKNAETYYLMAIVGSRTANTAMMYENLKKACQADPIYKEQAKEDREFIKYFEQADFKDAIK